MNRLTHERVVNLRTVADVGAVGGDAVLHDHVVPNHRWGSVAAQDCAFFQLACARDLAGIANQHVVNLLCANNAGAGTDDAALWHDALLLFLLNHRINRRVIHHQLGSLGGQLVVNHHVSVAGLVQKCHAVPVSIVRAAMGGDHAYVADQHTVLDFIVRNVATDIVNQTVVTNLNVTQCGVAQTTFHLKAFFDLNPPVQRTDTHFAEETHVENRVRLEVFSNFNQRPLLGHTALVLKHEYLFLCQFPHICLFYLILF